MHYEFKYFIFALFLILEIGFQPRFVLCLVEGLVDPVCDFNLVHQLAYIVGFSWPVSVQGVVTPLTKDYGHSLRDVPRRLTDQLNPSI